MRRLIRWTAWIAGAAGLVLATIIVGGAVDARYRLPELKPWHRFAPPSELREADLHDRFTLAEYLAREARVFDEVRQNIEERLDVDDRGPVNRYDPDSRTSPRRLGQDYNRTFELVPTDVRGGALMIHGLTDAPYSMRALAERFQSSGYYVLALRMPGHGTVPGALTQATWRDWLAAVRLGARHVRSRVGEGRPLVLVGYSNGGALAVEYSLKVLEGSGDPPASKLVLISPMIGVTPLARLARWTGALGFIPYFERARWLDVLPEYNPFKYNSFPANAGLQTFELTRALQASLASASRAGLIGRLPPALTFQSLIDATVSTHAVISPLYSSLEANGSELVLFDINRLSGLEPFIKPADSHLLRTLVHPEPRRYHLALVTNVNRNTLDVMERRIAAGERNITERPLGVAWPDEVFSLSHVALPFPPDDPVYGTSETRAAAGMLRLGALSPRGERAVLTVPVDQLMRISSNPFFAHMADRIAAWIEP
jgi:alpha-beta hydrolase superfamily lysophospholipase